MNTQSVLILIILASIIIATILIIQESIQLRMERKMAVKKILEQDMVKREERLKRELIAHNREQLALEYLNEGVNKQ